MSREETMDKADRKAKLKIAIEVKEIAQVMSRAASLIEKRNVSPELNYIKLIAKDSKLDIFASNGEIILKQTIGARVISEGQIFLSINLFNDIVANLGDQEIYINEKETMIAVEGRNCNFELLIVDSEVFGSYRDYDKYIDNAAVNSKESEYVEFYIDSKDFIRIYEYTNFSVSKEETRYNLNGVNFRVNGSLFKAASTDGHRLSVVSCNLDQDVAKVDIIVPKKPMQEIFKILSNKRYQDSRLKILVGQNNVIFSCDNILMDSKLIDGNFPDYTSFIPEDNSQVLKINGGMFASAINRVALVTIDNFKAVTMAITENGEQLKASGDAKGRAEESLAYSEDENKYCTFEGIKEFVTGFNPKYLLDVLTLAKEKNIEIFLGNPASPALIQIENSPNDKFVIMPVRV